MDFYLFLFDWCCQSILNLMVLIHGILSKEKRSMPVRLFSHCKTRPLSARQPNNVVHHAYCVSDIFFPDSHASSFIVRAVVGSWAFPSSSTTPRRLLPYRYQEYPIVANWYDVDCRTNNVVCITQSHCGIVTTQKKQFFDGKGFFFNFLSYYLVIVFMSSVLWLLLADLSLANLIYWQVLRQMHVQRQLLVQPTQKLLVKYDNQINYLGGPTWRIWLHTT